MPDKGKQILTIPNLLSVFRILLIPLIVWLYCGKQDYLLAAWVLLLSGVIAKDTKYYLGHLDELDTTEIPTVDR